MPDLIDHRRIQARQRAGLHVEGPLLDPVKQFLATHGVPVRLTSGNGKIHIYDRQTLTEVGKFGRIGRYAGEFIFLHNVAVDSKGNVYTTEVGNGRRVQKFLKR